MITLVFEDCGQGFREFDIDNAGRIVAARPDPECVWVGFMLVSEEIEIGDRLIIDLNNAAYTHLGLPEWVETEARVEAIKVGENPCG